MRIIRTISYEGDEAWLRRTIAKSISRARLGPGRTIEDLSLRDVDTDRELRDWKRFPEFDADPDSNRERSRG